MKVLSWLRINTGTGTQDLEDFRTYSSMVLISVLAALPHVLFLFFFWATRVWPLVWINVGSLGLYTLSYLLVRRRVPYVSAILMTVEVALYSLLTTWLLGLETLCLTFVFVALLPHYLFSDVTPLQRRCLLLLSFIAINGCLLIDGLLSPVYPGFGKLLALQVININVVFMALMAELWMNGLVRKLTYGLHQQRMREVQAESLRDPLTQLFNRRYLDVHFETWLEERNPDRVMLALLDLDDFKRVNDTYGHIEGDRVLRAFADGLRAQLRHTDLQVRWGGDEFVLVLHDVDSRQTKRLMEKLRRHFAENPMVIGAAQEAYPIVFSVGTQHYDPALSLEETLALCDQRMYESKRTKQPHEDGAEEKNQQAEKQA